MDSVGLKCVTAFSLLLVVCTSAVNPGLKARISQHGIQYAADEATKLLAKDVTSLVIPNQSGSSHVAIGHINYEVSNIHITSFAPPRTTVTTVPFKWSLMGTSASIHGDWHYWYKGFIPVSDHGSFDISISLDISTTVSMGLDPTGRPTIHTASCTNAVTRADLHFSGGASWLYNLFDNGIERAIRQRLEAQLCPAVERLINIGAEASLATMPVELDLHNMVVLDYSLVSPPAFTTTYIDALFKGEFLWITDKQECPFQPKPIPTVAPERKMVSFWITEYSINTLGYTEYKHGMLKYKLTKNDLAPKNQYILDTTCQSVFQPCIGGLVPQVAHLYPNSSVSLDLSVTEAPFMDIAPSGLTGKWVGVVNFEVMLPNATQYFLFSCNSEVTFNLTAGIANLNITTKVTDFSAKLAIKQSAIGAVDVESLNVVMKMSINGFVIPHLNSLGKEGMRLPAIRDVTYLNPELDMLENSLLVAVDLQYIG